MVGAAPKVMDLASVTDERGAGIPTERLGKSESSTKFIPKRVVHLNLAEDQKSRSVAPEATILELSFGAV
jgi:hypothetical protein